MTKCEQPESPQVEEFTDVADLYRRLELIERSGPQRRGVCGTRATEVEVSEHHNAYLARLSGEPEPLPQLEAARWIAEEIAGHIQRGISWKASPSRPVRRISVEVCFGVKYWHYREEYFAPEGLRFVPGIPALDARGAELSAQAGFQIWADNQMVLLAGCVSALDDYIEVHAGFTPLCLTRDYPTVERLFSVPRPESYSTPEPQGANTRALGLYALLSVTSWLQGFGSHLPLYLSLLAEAGHRRMADLLRRGASPDQPERPWLHELLELAGDEQTESVDDVLLAPILDALTRSDVPTGHVEEHGCSQD